MLLRVRPATDDEKRRAIVEEWYRERVKKVVAPLIVKWEPVMGVKVDRFFVQRMKTKWGSCTPGTRSIRLNTDLAKKPPECLEYIVVHEMVHLLVRRHNDRFVDLMDKCLPNWKLLRQALNNAPLVHVDWAC
jgi:predicted metal-dependent hydrolase